MRKRPWIGERLDRVTRYAGPNTNHQESLSVLVGPSIFTDSFAESF